jgi:cytochrome c5
MSRFHLLGLATVVLIILYASHTLFANTHNHPSDRALFTPQKTSNASPSENTPVIISNERGQQLYENHCRVCHSSAVSIRKNHKAHSYVDIQKWVYRWSLYLKLEWTEQDIQDVVNFLNQHFYHFPAENIQD